MLQAVIFDLYGTLIDIATDDADPSSYELLSRFLSYRGVRIGGEELRRVFFREMERAFGESREAYPEIDIAAVLGAIMSRYGGREYHGEAVRDAATLYRVLTMRRLALFPGVPEVLSLLKERYRLGLVTDAQWVYTEPEIRMLGLDRVFGAVIISSRAGFRKPDPRMFSRALNLLGPSAAEAVYVGDTPERDLAGARSAGMRCLLFRREQTQYDGIEPDAVFWDYRELPALLERL